jgi:hypothetical protein
MIVQGTFNIKRFWLKYDTPRDVLAGLNWHSGVYGSRKDGPILRYVDVNYYGDTDRDITIMELKYGDWIHDREILTYTVEGDDGLSEV